MAVNFNGGIKVVGAKDAKHQPPVSPEIKVVGAKDAKHQPPVSPELQCYSIVECKPVVEYETVIEHLHPLSSDEIRYLLTTLKKSTFTGEDMENLVIITMKLQEEYKKVLDNEEKNK